MARRADALFELTEALLCTDGPVKALVGLPLPRAADGRLVLAVDVSPWLRPDGNCSPQRSFCHTYGRGKDEHRMISGWPYSIVAALETARTSWTALLDAVRLPPGADVTTLTCAQNRQLVDRLTAAGQWQPADRDILIVLDAGYEAPRIAWLLRDLPIEIFGRMRSDRVLRRATPPRVHNPEGGRPAKHGGEFVFGDPATWDTEHAVTHTDTRLYGKVKAQAWNRLHPRLTRRAACADHDEALPIIAGTVIRVTVDHLPSRGEPKPPPFCRTFVAPRSGGFVAGDRGEGAQQIGDRDRPVVAGAGEPGQHPVAHQRCRFRAGGRRGGLDPLIVGDVEAQRDGDFGLGVGRGRQLDPVGRVEAQSVVRRRVGECGQSVVVACHPCASHWVNSCA
jgi:hypothetical protein